MIAVCVLNELKCGLFRLCVFVCSFVVVASGSDLPVGLVAKLAVASELEMRWHFGQGHTGTSEPVAHRTRFWRASTPETGLSHEFHLPASCDWRSTTRNPMLATKLCRAQLELHAHRTWLRSFSLRSTASASFSTTAQRPARPAAESKTYSRPSFLDKSSSKPASRKPFAQRKKDDDFQELAVLNGEISRASKEGDFDAAMVAYRAIEKKRNVLRPSLLSFTSAMAYWSRCQQALHEDKQDPETSEKLQQYAEELAQDIMKGALGPCAPVSANLLNHFIATRTWDSASKLWKWSQGQGDEYVNDDVYGAAVALLAAQDAKLEDVEALYQEGLARLPVGFAAYHFSPGAIVPNREGNMILTGVPTPLLLAIMSARLMRGDAQNAYLALDAITRLRPVALNPKFYTDYQRERPVAEAYTVFAMACKAGTVLPSNAYRSLMSALRSNADTNDMRRFVLTVRAMLSATYLQIGAGGKLTRNAVTEMIIVLSTICRVKGVNAMQTEDRLRLREAVQELISKVLELASRFSAGPTIAAYNSIITNVAGAGNAEPTITAAIREARVLGLEPTIVTRRSILVAAGSAGDMELVTKAWRWLTDARVRDGLLPDATDMHILAKAAVQSNHAAFAKGVVSNASHLEDWQRENLLERLDQKFDLIERRGVPANLQSLLTEVAKIKDDLEVFDNRTSDARGVQDFSNQAVPMLVFTPPFDVRLPEDEMRELYDQLTTDPKAPQQSGGEPAVTMSTKVPFAQLRYENWKLVTYLLAEADRHDKAYIKAVDSAIANGQAPPQRNYGELFEGTEEITGVGLSDPVQSLEISDQEIDMEKARARICELRKVDVPQVKVQREV